MILMTNDVILTDVTRRQLDDDILSDDGDSDFRYLDNVLCLTKDEISLVFPPQELEKLITKPLSEKAQKRLKTRPLDKLKEIFFKEDLSDFECTDRDCPNHRKCIVDKIPRGHRNAAFIEMWGSLDAPASSRKEMQSYTYQALLAAFSVESGTFQFCLSMEGFAKIEICEKAWLKVHGILGKNNRHPRWYNAIKERVSKRLPRLMKFANFRKEIKTIDINLYIDKIKLECADCLPTSNTQEHQYKYSVPFATVSQFYNNFVYTSMDNFIVAYGREVFDDMVGDPPDGMQLINHYAKTLDLGCYVTFKRILKTHHKDVRLLKCKGSFPTCDVCVGASQLLNHDGKRWNDIERQAINLWHKEHVDQQAAERRDQARRIELARTQYDKRGQPSYLYLTADAMTDYTTRTPKIFRKGERISKSDANNDSKIKARVMGFHAVCGPYEGLYIAS